MTVSIYHNPRCSKSRQTLQLLEQNGLTPEIVEYLKTPPDAGTLGRLLDMLGLEPRELMRTKEAEYKSSGAAMLPNRVGLPSASAAQSPRSSSVAYGGPLGGTGGALAS